MTFQLQPPAKVWDEEITTDKWPLPPAKPWETKSSIEQMCEEASMRLAIALDEACHAAWMRHCQAFGIQHRMHVASDGTRTVLLSGDEWPAGISEQTLAWHAEGESVWFFEPVPVGEVYDKPCRATFRNVCRFQGQP